MLLLDARDSLQLVVNLTDEADALCLALTCRVLRDAVFVRFPARPPPSQQDSTASAVRLQTHPSALTVSTARFLWARELPGHPPWLDVSEDTEDLLSARVAASGNLELLRMIHANEGCGLTATTCSAAARSGHTAVLQYARKNDCPWDAGVCSGAAAHGHLAVLRWARENGCPWAASTCRSAAAAGHLPVLRWARENGCRLGIHPIVALEEQLLNMIVNLAYKVVELYCEVTIEYNPTCRWTSWTCAQVAMGGRGIQTPFSILHT
jgi:hypothetical protein